ncbi:LPXTG cell wall anchor domain-containing protein, partial [Listeria booriae]
AQPVDPVIPADPETPMHVTPAPVQMADPIVSSVSAPDPVRELPKTGDTTTGNTILFGGLFAALGAFLLRRKK